MTSEPVIFLESAARILLIVHALAAMAMAGAATHNGVLAWRALSRRSVPWRLVRVYATVMLWAQLATVLLGFLVYPAFRVYVRAQYLDLEVPLATGFFEVKEHWSMIALAALAWMWPMSRWLGRSSSRREVVGYAILGLSVALTVWLSLITGLALVTIRSV